ncbi:glycosyltransferase family 1 protein [Congregibacter variabilis]|uniref:Glycosyltransferase family 1 protein n=1 Tax=Congregibacter variabilis TaxID=3081200 RepID=A0ABZ0I9D9_9GAMM|nr:glycosyltransferase family 1 protein [Congregibacter sp. IMCC43200]
MRVGLFVDVLKHSERSGIGRHVLGLVHAIAKLDQKNTYLLYHTATAAQQDSLRELLPQQHNMLLRSIPMGHRFVSERPRVFWGYLLPAVLTVDRLDVFHGPNFFAPLRGRFRRISTIHDLAFIHTEVHGNGLDRLLADWTIRCATAADRVIAVSDATRVDCIDIGIPNEKIVRIYQGFEHPQDVSSLDAGERTSEIAQGPYLLYVGTLQPRKNLETLIEAFSRLSAIIPHNLILAGAKAESFDLLNALVNSHGLTQRVTFTGYVSDSQRHALYQNADLFIYPSLYEGFGLVLLEAMAHRVATIAANNSSLPEAGGEATAFFNTHDSDDLASTILRLIQNPQERTLRIEEGLRQISRFSWTSSAKEHVLLYQQLASHAAS